MSDKYLFVVDAENQEVLDSVLNKLNAQESYEKHGFYSCESCLRYEVGESEYHEWLSSLEVVNGKYIIVDTILGFGTLTNDVIATKLINMLGDHGVVSINRDSDFDHIYDPDYLSKLSYIHLTSIKSLHGLVYQDDR